MGMANQDMIVSLLRGTSTDGGRVQARDIRAVARESLARARVGIGCDPRYLALALGYKVRAMTTGTDPPSDPMLIAYDWVPNARECGLNVFLGIGDAMFRERKMRTDARDVYRLAGWIALPEDVRHVGLCDLENVQPHAPSWFLQAHLLDIGGSGIRQRPAIFGAG